MNSIFKWIVFVDLFIGLLFPVSVVFAEGETETPNPTSTSTPTPIYTPIIGTDTGDIYEGECPAGTPLPTQLAFQYYVSCFSCVPESTSSFPTLDLNLLGTVTPTIEGTSYLTPTPTQDVSKFKIFPSWHTLYELEENVVDHREVLNWSYASKPVFYGYAHELFESENAEYVYTIIWAGHDILKNGTSSERSYMVYTNDNDNSVITINFKEGIMAGTSVTLQPRETYTYDLCNQAGGCDFYFSEVFEVITVGTDPDRQYGLKWDLKHQNYSSSGNNTYVDFSYYSGYWIDPMLPTPIAPGYCTTYDYVGEEEEETLAGYTGIEVYQGACMILIPDWNVHLDAVGEIIPEINWDITGFSICPLWVNLGQFNIMEIVIPGDILVIPVVIFVLGLIFAL